MIPFLSFITWFGNTSTNNPMNKSSTLRICSDTIREWTFLRRHLEGEEYQLDLFSYTRLYIYIRYVNLSLRDIECHAIAIAQGLPSACIKLQIFALMKLISCFSSFIKVPTFKSYKYEIEMKSKVMPCVFSLWNQVIKKLNNVYWILNLEV